jgi:hypothetical protein
MCCIDIPTLHKFSDFYQIFPIAALLAVESYRYNVGHGRCYEYAALRRLVGWVPFLSFIDAVLCHIAFHS